MRKQVRNDDQVNARAGTLLLVSSDARLRYVEDILVASAAPTGARIRFQYARQYVPNDIWRDASDGNLKGLRGLITFVSRASSPAVVPVRFVDIVAAEIVADVLVVTLSLCGFGVPKSRSQGGADNAAQFLAGLVEANGAFVPITERYPPLAVDEADATHDTIAAWSSVVERLAQTATFENTQFIQVCSVQDERGRPLALGEDGTLRVIERRRLHVIVTSYDRGGQSLGGIRAEADGLAMTVSPWTDPERAVRFDLHELVFDAAAASRTVQGFVRVLVDGTPVKSDGGTRPRTAVRLPVTVSPSRSARVYRATCAGLGGALVAAPGIATGAPIGLRIALGGAGAALLAYTQRSSGG